MRRSLALLMRVEVLLALLPVADRNFKRPFLPAPPGATPQPRQRAVAQAADGGGVALPVRDGRTRYGMRAEREPGADS